MKAFMCPNQTLETLIHMIWTNFQTSANFHIMGSSQKLRSHSERKTMEDLETGEIDFV